MEVKHRQTESKGAFLIEVTSNVGAQMTYSKAGTDRLIIDHTEVSEELRGTGAGKQLVIAAVEYARAHDVKIIPLCPFAKSVFDKNKDMHDVLA
ncbi:N-acetyltransferase [Fulvivirga sp. RKSG066]|uniref:GNAT family N-acetyltransferase n=1 Tax=Fulvivirga aurantia TaxID=2529383 RepID=UPI0012BC73DD|nr:GNAT family N-acetyltransferase [Fulvivirga aurantia]MTI21016.1 N-acetyltransferase [Fulvivirga aurantia]